MACKKIAERIQIENNIKENEKIEHDKTISTIREQVQKRHCDIKNFESNLGINRSNSVRKSSTIKESSNITHSTRLSNIKHSENVLNKSDFRGLILSNYSLPYMKRYIEANSINTESKKVNSELGFPFPVYTGIPYIAMNQPLSRSININNTKNLSRRIRKSAGKIKRRIENKAEIESEISVILNRI